MVCGMRETGIHEKLAQKRNRFGIWRCLLGVPPRHGIHYIFIKLFSVTTFVLQIVCRYLEPFKSNRASNLTILNKKLSCRREAARCFVFVCSQLQHTYSAVFLLPVTAASDLLVHKILLWFGYAMVKNFRRYLF